jgi:formate-dependent nitrite reductase cytochrome c552 subunit
VIPGRPANVHMDIEALIFSILFGLALLPFAWRLRRSGAGGMAFLALAFWIAITIGVSQATRNQRPPVTKEADLTHRPIETPSRGYASSDTCRSCHPQEYHTWHNSYHRSMTQVASPDSIKGDFNNADIELLGSRFNLQREGDDFFAELDYLKDWIPGGEKPPRIRRKIELVTGSHHMQVYWYSEGRERKLMQLPIIYNFEVARWVPRDSMFLRPTAKFSDEEGRWNITCIKCHTTRGEQRVASLNSMDSQVAEFGIACEECHGPGEAHVLANQNPARRYAMRDEKQIDDTIVLPTRLSPKLQSHVCGQCHGIYFDQVLDAHNAYEPGQDVTAERELVRFGKNPIREAEMAEKMGPDYLPGLFWSDGMVRVSGREFNGLVESPCATHGDESRGVMSCLSCHSSHQHGDDPRPLKTWADDQLKPGMRGNQACTQCHESFAQEKELIAHTHHAADSSGSLCFNCHMPFTTYGLVKALRSHTIQSPDIQANIETGRPSACNQCHLDRTTEWAGNQLNRWYGHEIPSYTEEHRAVSTIVAMALRGDAGQRALAAWNLGWQEALEASGNDWQTPHLAPLLNDRYLAVRFVAERSLRRLPGLESLEYDFLGPNEQRTETVATALKIWSRQRPKDSRPTLLIDENGLQQERFDAMISRRDDRDMSLLE